MSPFRFYMFFEKAMRHLAVCTYAISLNLSCLEKGRADES